MFHIIGLKHVPQHKSSTNPTLIAQNMSQNMYPEHVLKHGLQSRLAQHWCALLSEQDHCSSAWPAAVIGQSRPTLTILLFMTCATSHSRIDEAFPLNSFHEGWHHVT